MFFCSTVAQVLQQLDDSSDDESPVDIYLQPPADVDGLTDEDSDKSDDEHIGSGDHLGRQLLNTACEVTRRTRQSASRLLNSAADDEPDTLSAQGSENESEDDEEAHAGPSTKRTRKSPEDVPKWKKSKTVDLQEQVFHAMAVRSDVMMKTPAELFNCFFDDEMISDIVEETNRYAGQHNNNLLVTVDEMMTFIGGLLLSGYSKLLHRRLY